MDCGVRNSFQNSPFYAAALRRMGSKHEPFHRPPERAEFLVASSAAVQHDPDVSGRHAERSRRCASWTQFENQAIRNRRYYIESRSRSPDTDPSFCDKIEGLRWRRRCEVRLDPIAYA